MRFAGIFFGIVLVKSEAMSWFRIREMFRFEAFHMYGLIGSAVAAGAISVWLDQTLQGAYHPRRTDAMRQTLQLGVV